MKTTTFFFPLFCKLFFLHTNLGFLFFGGGEPFFSALSFPLLMKTPSSSSSSSSAHIISSIWCRPFKVVREEKHHHVCDDDGGGGGDIISPDECWQCCLEERGRAFEYEQSVAL